MNSSRGKLILDVSQGRISIDSFISQFGADPRSTPDIVRNELEEALTERSADSVEYALILGFHFGLSPSWTPVLCKLLAEEWHFKHEDIASALQDIRAPSTVADLYQAALKKHDYLAYDDSSALAVKCIWALHGIGTADAIAKLKLLSDSDSDVIRETARKRLSNLEAKRPGDPDPAYRRARDKLLRPEGH